MLENPKDLLENLIATRNEAIYERIGKCENKEVITNVSILVYTHTEYSFMWKAMIPLLQKHVKDIDIHWLYETTADSQVISDIPNNWFKHTYDESLYWTKRVGKAVSEINDDYILFLHEDWLPIGDVKKEVLYDMINFMKEQTCGFLTSYVVYSKLNSAVFTGYKDCYYYPEPCHVFQPAIWNKETLSSFCSDLNKSKFQNEDPECSNYMSRKNCWAVANITTVNTARSVNSLFYPHMHALAGGRWTFKKYPVLKEFLETFGIDTSSRIIDNTWELHYM